MKNKILILMIAAFLTGCSGNMQNSASTPAQQSENTSYAGGSANAVARSGNDWDMNYLEVELYAYDTNASTGENYETGTTQNREQKIIQTGNVHMQSDRFDETAEALRSLAPDVGGFVESASMRDASGYYSAGRWHRTRALSITLRVPRDQFDEVLRQVESLATVRSSNQSAEDVTASYYDLQGRLETKRIEEERVLDMITRAETIKDLLTLENRLGQIRTDIERFGSQIVSIDRLAAFSTIHVQLEEVTTETLMLVSEGLGERMSHAFISSLNGMITIFQNIIIFLAGVFFQLLFFGIWVGIAFWIGIKFTKKAKIKPKEV